MIDEVKTSEANKIVSSTRVLSSGSHTSMQPSKLLDALSWMQWMELYRGDTIAQHLAKFPALKDLGSFCHATSGCIKVLPPREEHAINETLTEIQLKLGHFLTFPFTSDDSDEFLSVLGIIGFVCVAEGKNRVFFYRLIYRYSSI